MNSIGIYSKFSYLFLFIFFYLTSPAQNYNWISTWQPGGTLDFHSSTTDGQGNTYAAYYSWNESTQINKLAVVKHSSQGAFLWDVMIADAGYSNDIKMFYSEADKLYAWVNDYMYIYSSEGELLSSFLASYSNHNKIFVNSDEEVIVTFSGVEHGGSTIGFGAAKFNAAGLLIWDDIYRNYVSTGGSFYLVDSEIDSDGNIYLLGMDNANAVVMKAAPNGLEQWEQQIPYIKVNDFELSIDNSIYIAGRASNNMMGVTSFDNDGIFRWTKTYSAPQGNGQYMKLLESNSGIYAAGYHGVPFVGNVLFVHHFSENGDLLFEYEQEDPSMVPQISFNEADYGFSMIYTGSLFIGCLFTTSNEFNYGLIRLNSLGELAGYSYIEGTNYGYSCLTFDAYLYGGGITQLCIEPLANWSNEYQLKIINYPTNITSVEDGENLPHSFSLSQNYPNPFNPTTKISYSIPKAGQVQLEVYDALGRKVQTLVNEFQHLGSYSVDIKFETLSSGIYYYKLSTGNFSEIRKMVLLK